MPRTNRSCFDLIEERIAAFSCSAGTARFLVFAVLAAKYCRRDLALSLPRLDGRDIPAALGEYDRFFSTAIFSAAAAAAQAVADIGALIRALESLPERITLEFLSGVYERCVTPHDIKKEGIYYTPSSVAQSIVRGALAAGASPPDARCGEDVFGLRTLDPACGSGIFLIELYRALLKQLSRNGPVGFETKCRLVRDCIFGVDRDEHAVSTARFLLQLALLEDRQLELFSPVKLPDLSANIRTGNSLLEPEDFDLAEQELGRELKAFSWRASFPQVFSRGGFDIVVGNPPYGLSRDDQIGDAENEKLKAVFQERRTGKINKYLAFMAKGYDILAPGGALSFIVPNAWLGIRGGAALRSLFLRENALKSITVYDYPVFDEASVEAVVFVALKGQKQSRIQVRRLGRGRNGRTEENFSLPVTLCLKNPEFTIPTRWSPETTAVFEHLSRYKSRLGDQGSGFIPMIALQAYARGKGAPPQSEEDVKNHIFDRTRKEDECTHPYLQGGDVERYRIAWSGGYLRYGPWLAEPQRLERFSGPRILLREITGAAPYALKACYTRKLYLYNKSVLHILPGSGSGETELLALLAVLNSRLASFMIVFGGRKSQRKLFRKIVNDDLKDLRLPSDFHVRVLELAALSRRMIELRANGKETAELESAIDRAVFETYEFPAQLEKAVDLLMSPAPLAARGAAH